MFKLNNNYENLKQNYLFAETARRIEAYKAAHPEKKVIKLSIGDVTLPICQAARDAMREAVDEMGDSRTFKGYGDYEGYAFLREAVSAYYEKRGVAVDKGEIYVTSGAKEDVGCILDIFSKDNKVLVPDPVYPVYVDTNIMDGRDISFMRGTEENGFLPSPSDVSDDVEADIVYLCSPNNPTGSVFTREALEKWVAFARERRAVIFFDAAYEAYVADKSLPRSIFEIDGARECAIEFCSLSKTAGFTGLRCGFTVIPSELRSGEVALGKRWLRRQSTKYNGTSYVIQRGAAAVFTDEGQKQVGEQIAYYHENARLLGEAFAKLGVKYFGGKNSPYIWLKCPKGFTSWEFFDYLLDTLQLAGTPGAGFGDCGEGWFRLTAFGSRENVLEAIERLKTVKF